MRNLLSLLICLRCISSFAQQNLISNYIPLKSQGPLPEIFTKDVNESVAQDITDINADDADKKLKSVYLLAANYEIEKKVKSGNTLINDEITVYLNQLVDIILKDQPELRKKISVFTLKSPVVNAYCYDKGYLFVDVGLIAQAENEAQLAYILCHEISHYVKQHNILGFIHNEKLESSIEGKSEEALMLERCQYSKEHESEADSEGFKLLEKTNYDLQQTLGVFDVLQYSHMPFELIEFKKTFFESDNFKIPERYFMKDLAAIKNNSNEDDSESTHPNTAKRKAAIEKLIDKNSISGRVKSILGEKKFNYIRDLSRFEVCRLSLKTRDYGDALYSAYVLSQSYPDNLFLAQTISKSLYAITLYRAGYLRYNKDSYLDGPKHYLEVESYPQQLYHLINKMPDNEWNLMALNYAFRKHKKFPNDKILQTVSDSLLGMMYYTNCELETFGETNDAIKNVNAIKDTTSYYKNMFADLFLTDKEFADKFPKTVGHDIVIPYTPKSYKIKKMTKMMREVDKISIVMSLEPFYIIFDDSEAQTNYVEADKQQKILVESIKQCALEQNFKLVVLDPGLVTNTEVDKVNDFSVVSDWLYERMDGRDNEKSRVPVFSADDIKDVITKYNTSHVLKTGFVVLDGKTKQYVFYTVIYDLKENREVYIKQQLFSGKLSKQEAKNKICDLFYELKNGIKQK